MRHKSMAAAAILMTAASAVPFVALAATPPVASLPTETICIPDPVETHVQPNASSAVRPQQAYAFDPAVIGQAAVDPATMPPAMKYVMVDCRATALQNGR